MKKYILLLMLVSTIVLSSCEDFLDLTPISDLTTGNGYETANLLESALVGAYESFQSSEYYVWDNLLFQDVRADNNYAGGDNPEIFQIDLLEITPTHTRIFTHWSNIYNAISKANTVLENVAIINDPALTEERKNQIRGEALFLRAYHYFTLVKMFGGVPLITNTITSLAPQDTNITRASVEEVYSQILLDLDEAITLLPETYSNDASVNKARATSGAANALAAKVIIQSPNVNYDEVLEHITAVENSTANYRLIDYNDLFSGNSPNNAESIIEVQYLGGDEGNFGPQLLLPPSVSGDTWRKFVTPSVDIVNAFDSEGDEIRKNASILFETVNWVDEYWGNSPGTSVPFGFKMKNANGFASADRQYLLRFGDIILLKAEALNELGQTAAAVVEVNKIRNRVSLPNLTQEQQASQEALRTAILKERRLELFLEGHRWDDLVRNNQIIETMNNLVEIDLRTGNPVNYNMTAAKILLPIPQQERDRNTALTQNPL